MGNIIIQPLHIIGSLHYGGIEKVVYNYFQEFYLRGKPLNLLVIGDADGILYEKYLSVANTIHIIKPSLVNLSLVPFITKYFLRNKFNFIHLHLDSKNAHFALILKIITHSHLISHSHNSGQLNFRNSRRLLNKFSGLISDSNFACSHQSGVYFWGLDKFKLFYNAIPVDEFLFNQSKRNIVRNSLKLNHTKVLIQIGSLIKIKNHIKSIEILSELNKTEILFHLLVIGEGKLKPNLLEKTKEMNQLNNVTFLGTTDRISDFLCASDIMLLPSLIEGSPTVILEAMANGLPSIVSDTVTLDYSSEMLMYANILQENENWISKINWLLKNTKRGLFSLNHNYNIVNACNTLEAYYDKES